MSCWPKRAVLPVAGVLPQYPAYRPSTRWHGPREPDKPNAAHSTTHKSRLGHNARGDVPDWPSGIWQWDLNRTHDDGFGWSLPRLRIPCLPTNWLALQRKIRCRRYLAWTSRPPAPAA